jgi:hypothetical protein
VGLVWGVVHGCVAHVVLALLGALILFGGSAVGDAQIVLRLLLHPSSSPPLDSDDAGLHYRCLLPLIPPVRLLFSWPPFDIIY